MKSLSRSIAGAFVVVALGASSLAQADPRDDRGPGHGQGRGPDRAVAARGDDHRHDAHRGPGRDHRPGRGPGIGPDHHFHRGERLPMAYRSHVYVVNDWRGHRLGPPPRGYHWVQVGADYALVAITSGLIFQVVIQP